MTEHAYERWQVATRDLVGDVAQLQELQDRRYRYAAAIGTRLTEPWSDGAAATGAAVYGVICEGPGLIYIGQTTEAQRRLRDLCIGESHHLANTVPPEVWDQIVVVWWPKLLAQLPISARNAIAELSVGVVGEALERLLQIHLQPVLNSRRRTRQGGWQQRSNAATGSRGAQAAAVVGPLYDLVQTRWTLLCSVTAKGDSHDEPFGRTVYPTRMIGSQFRNGPVQSA